MVSVGTAAAKPPADPGPTAEVVLPERPAEASSAAEPSPASTPTSSGTREPAEPGTSTDIVAGQPVGDPRRERIASCMASHEKAQVARLSGGFLESIRELKACASPKCPEVLRSDCLQWRHELDSLIPSVVIGAEADSGDMVEARVLVDGVVVRESLDGRPIALDPGTHRLQVVLPDGRSQEQRIVLAEGERGRRVLFSFRSKEEVRAPARAQQTKVTRPIPPGVYVLGGTAFVALGVGVGFGSDAWSKARTARDLCAPLCDDDVSRAVTQRAMIADVALGIFVASAVGAVLVYSYRPRRVVPLSEVHVGWVPNQGGGELQLEGAF